MVLHLLGKKSWNVYNTDNVDRVRRDEAEARARDEAHEQRTQEEDAARRLAILRGEDPPELIEEEPAAEHVSARSSAQPRKRRKLRGEDDTAAEIRHARQDVEAGERARTTLAKAGHDHDAPLLDHAGHLQLIPAPNERDIRKAEKNAELEAEKAKKRKWEEEQYTMRFSNAAGFNSSMQQKPWYAAKRDTQDSGAVVLEDTQGKDAWGNEDPRRREREQNRMSKSDPFAAMQQAQRQLKQSERDRESWKRERDREMEEMRAEKRERRHTRERRRRDDGDPDSLDGFSLDGPAERARSDHDRHRRHRHRRRRSRSRSRSEERRRRSRE